jgi:hypothetical protein
LVLELLSFLSYLITVIKWRLCCTFRLLSLHTKLSYLQPAHGAINRQYNLLMITTNKFKSRASRAECWNYSFKLKFIFVFLINFESIRLFWAGCLSFFGQKVRDIFI